MNDILKDQIGSVFWGDGEPCKEVAYCSGLEKVTEAVQNIASGIAEMRSTGTTLWMPLFLSHLALANAEAGQSDQAWANIHEAITTLETTKRTGTKLRSIASPEKLRCFRRSARRPRRKPISRAPLR